MTKFLLNLFGERNTRLFYNFLTYRLRKISAQIHQKQMEFEWSRKNEPRWFNHFSDQFYQFRENKNSIWLERGVFTTLVLNNTSNVLEIGCGDGFNTFHFFSERCRKITAIDFDENALSFAKKYNSNSKIEYKKVNILEGLPGGIYDNVIWDGSIEQFSEFEINSILSDIKNSLSDKGILSGYTAKGDKKNKINLSHNKREFESKSELISLLRLYFKNVLVLETMFKNKVSFYFFASEKEIPIELTGS